MKMYKGFDKNLKCRGFQYEIGEEYEEEKATLCDCGFHACENPIDVFKYYPPNNSRYCEVDLEEVTNEEECISSKRCGKRIRIGAEIGIKGIIDAFVKFTLDKIDRKDEKATNTGYQSAATNTGDRSAATNIGNRSAATNTGYYSAATNTGNYSAATNTGYQSAATNTGNYSAATNTGDRSAATNIGNRSAATNTGYQSAATNIGYEGVAIVEGKDSIAMASGIKGKAKGALGCYIVLAEWREAGYGEWYLADVKSAKVDGENIKADTFYRLEDGKFEEVE